jgi:ribosome maturation protein Sdo1
MILEYKGDRVNVETMALAINLTTVPNIATNIIQKGGLKFLMKRAFKTQDPLMFKIVRNIFQHNYADIQSSSLVTWN